MIQFNTNVVYMVSVLVAIGLFFKYVKNNDESELKCVISHVDGNTYCVRERAKIQLVADLLAKVTKKLGKLVEYMKQNHPDHNMTKRLVENFNPQKVYETLPTSKHVAYTQNKGKKMAFCVTKQKEGNNLIDENTLTFVAIHEMAHIATESVGHKQEFWNNFKELLKYSKDAGVYEPERYKLEPKEYCGMKITDNPYFDLKH